jgi:DNA-binding response OmpR family regulator
MERRTRTDSHRILVVEDYAPLRESIGRGLRREGHAVETCGDGCVGLEKALAGTDLVVLDLMLPGYDGIEFLRRFRSRGKETPVLILTARDGIEDRIRGLDAGGDDYLVKPFAFEEFLARVRALLRRHGAADTLRVGALGIDTQERIAVLGEDILELTAKEFSMLEYLARRSGSPVGRQELLDHLYPESPGEHSNVIEVYVGTLRRKLEAGGRPRLLHTRRGFGYVLEDQQCS